jgi:hypothetical protein
MTRLRITHQMPGGIETPRLHVPGAPTPPSGGVGAHINIHANASRYRPAVVVHIVGA